MPRLLLGIGLIVASLWFLGNRPACASQQDSGQNVPDAPQPQKKPAAKAHDASGPGSASKPNSAEGDPSSPQSDSKSSSNGSSDGASKPSSPSPSAAEENPFPEDLSRKAAQESGDDVKSPSPDTSSAPGKDADKDTSPDTSKAASKSTGQGSNGQDPNKDNVAAPAPRTSAVDNPFPEDISRKAAKTAGENATSPDGSENPTPKVPLPPGVSSSQSSALPDANQAPDPHTVTDPVRAKKDTQVADFYLAQGNLRGAYQRYKDATAFDPTNVNAIFGLAEACKALKQLEEAQRNYMLYLEIEPNGPKAKQALKALSSMEGK